MTPSEREHVVRSLPTDMPLDLHPPEGDAHRKPKSARATLSMDELVSKLNGMLSEIAEARDNALERAEDEARRADAVTKELERVRAELEELRRRTQ